MCDCPVYNWLRFIYEPHVAQEMYDDLTDKDLEQGDQHERDSTITRNIEDTL